MLKKTLLVSLFVILVTSVYSQQYSRQNLIGRWSGRGLGDFTTNLFFLNDSIGAFATSTGLLGTSIRYTAIPVNGNLKFTYTTEIDSKRKRTVDAAIRFLNDSTFVFKLGNSLSVKIDTNNKNFIVYKKVPDCELKIPTWHNLVNSWSVYFKKEISASRLIFKDSTNAIFSFASGKITYCTYKVDFKKSPAPIIFYYQDSTPPLEAFIMFLDNNVIRLETFPQGKSPDHFTVFGHNVMYVNEYLADKIRSGAIQLSH